jgi:D-alanine-D-alanine ligase
MITVGFTYDLRDDYIAQGFSEEESAEFDSQETVDSIAQALRDNGFALEKIGNIKALVSALAEGRRWEIIFNICEGVKGIGREAQVPALLEAYDIPYTFSSSDVMVLTMNKALAKYVVHEHGIPTPAFSTAHKIEDLENINLTFPLFVKPLAEGTSKGVSEKSRVSSKKELLIACSSIWETHDQTALIESFLPGREFTVGLIGTGKYARVVGLLEIILKDGAEKWCYSYRNKVACLEEFIKPIGSEVEKICNLALDSWVALGCRDAGRIDVRLDACGIANFIEVNPLAGLRPGYSEFPILASKSGINYTELIGLIMEEALRRYGLNQQKKQRQSGLMA